MDNGFRELPIPFADCTGVILVSLTQGLGNKGQEH